MLKVQFYEGVDDELIKFAVIGAKSNGRWVFCQHKNRDTWEMPGGHREAGESVMQAARRELYEETGALDYEIYPVCVYSVSDGKQESFGMLYEAEIHAFEGELHSEIARIQLTEKLPEKWTYPLIQPFLLEALNHRDAG